MPNTGNCGNRLPQRSKKFSAQVRAVRLLPCLPRYDDKTVSKKSDEALAKELAQYSGVVAGSNGKGGSGTCIELENGKIAVLTARHVVLECLRNTGRVGIAAYNVKFQDPNLIRMDSSQQGDAAYLVFKDAPAKLKAIRFAEWTKNRSDIAVGQRAMAVGFPGTLRKIDGRQLIPEFAWLRDRIFSIEGNRVVSGINETVEGISSTFEGLSGGGLFSDDGRFIGVVVEERRRVTEFLGELQSLLPGEFAELYTPYSIPPDAPRGKYHNDERALRIVLQKPDGSGIQAIVGALAQCLWSKTNPEHKYGRLYSLEFVIPGIDEHYPININSTFSWSGDTDADRLKAMDEEFKFLLLRMRWLLKDDPDGMMATLEVNPLT